MPVSLCLQEEQFAGLLRDLNQLTEAYNSGQNNSQHPEKAPINSNWTLTEKSSHPYNVV